MDDRQIRDEAVTLILAGHETSAMALSWTLYLLATHPEIEARLVEHLEAELHGAPAGTEDLPRLSYLKQVVLEAMRIYPPVWGVVRRAEKETELGDYVLPARTWVGIVTWARSTAIPSSGPTRSASTRTGSRRNGRKSGTSSPTCRLRRDPGPASGPAWRCSRSS